MKSIINLLFAISMVLSACETTPLPTTEPTEYEFFKNVEVGSQPAKIFYDEAKGLFHIICLGKDVDFDGIKDTDDENPSWWIINKNDLSNPQKMLEFDFGYMGFPFRPCFDWNERSFFISQSGEIKQYNIDNFNLVSTGIGNYYASAISKDGDTLYLSINQENGKPGRVIIYNYKNKQEISSITAGLNVQQVLNYQLNGKKMLAVMSEGLGNQDAMLQFVELKITGAEVVKKFENIGKYANFMTMAGGKLFLILNGSHEIWEYNLNDYSITKTFSSGTSGFNGPREAVIQNSYEELYVTTYNGDVRVFDTKTGALKKTYPVDSKAEGMYLLKDEVFLVCNISNADYSANNKVSIFRAK
ncbi:hypothetical protein D9V86_12240 [Bacteroidetes/Chlorobi group bacterium ChocPot_Mid]|nr:MAG: hypothetical protein D9V86_12240 [Bacteroidetes/Chlorobi group bacterium ChocPot_Mid]